MFLQVSVILSTGGVRGCQGGHAWLLGGMHGCGGACVVAGGACVVAWGCVWLPGGHAWLLGGMHGCRGACMVAGGPAWLLGGWHVWLGGCAWLSAGMHRIWRDTVNELAVRILLECILVCVMIPRTQKDTSNIGKKRTFVPRQLPPLQELWWI